MEHLSFEELLSKLREAHDREVRTAAGGNAHDVVPCSSNNLASDISVCSLTPPTRQTSADCDVFGDAEGAGPRNASILPHSSSILPARKSSAFFDIFGDSEGVQRNASKSSEVSSGMFEVIGDSEGGHRASISSPRNASIIPRANCFDRRESQGSARMSVSTNFSIRISKPGPPCARASSKSGVIGLRPEWTDELNSNEGEDEVEFDVVPVHQLKRGWRRHLSVESADSRKRSLVWGPQSIWRRCIEAVEFILLLYECCWIPVQIAFNPRSLRVTSAIEYALTLFWTFDMCLSFNCGYVDHLGHEVMDRRLIASRYLKTWFLVDFAVVLPDWIFLVIDSVSGQERSAWVGQVLSAARIMRVLRLQKLYRVFHAFEKRLNSSLLLMMFQAWRLVFVLGYIIHILACVWYLIGTSSTDGWIHGHNLAHTNKLHLYANALFWSLTRFHGESIIDPQTTFEIFFCSFVGFGALLSFSSFVSTVTNMMLSLSRMQEKQTYAAQLLNEYLETHCISVDLSVRAKTCLNSRSSGCEEQVKLDSIGLSKQIIADIKEEANRPFLFGHPLFMAIFKIHGRSLRYICNEACVQKSYAPGEDVFVMDDPCDAMIIQTAGCATYSYNGDEDNGVAETVRKGDWFAEVCLWAVWVYRGTLKTESSVSTVEVSVSGFLAMVRTFAPFFSNGFFSRYAQMFLETLASSDVISDRVTFSISIALPKATYANSCNFRSLSTLSSSSHEDVTAME